MTDIRQFIDKWSRKLAAARPRSAKEEYLVTSRRAFLGLLAAGAAYAAMETSPVLAILDSVQDTPETEKLYLSEGKLQIQDSDGYWVTIGWVADLSIDQGLPKISSTLGVDGNFAPARFQYGARRNPKLQLALVADGNLKTSCDVLKRWLDEAFNPRSNGLPVANVGRRNLRFSCFGLSVELGGCILSWYDVALNSEGFETLRIDTFLNTQEIKPLEV